MDAFMERIPISRLREWLAFFHLEGEDAKDRALEAEAEAKARANQRPRRR